MPTPFTLYAGADQTVLTSSLLALNSGVSVNAASVVLHASGADAVNIYDGSLTALGIGAGLLLTTGTTPGLTNTVDWFGQDNSATSGAYYNGDAEIDAVVNSVFQTQSFDATTLSFDFTVSDPAATSVSFDLVFGSDEYPEWVDQFVDCAIVTLNGVNYALFNHDPNHPLSVVSSNLASGYFQNNAIDPVTGVSPLPIEYDGVSHVLKIVAPILPGGAINHIKIGIADTGDHIYDSGIFVANFAAGTIPGSGVVATQPGDCTDNSDVVTGSTQDEYFNLKDGNDTLYAGAGDDIVVAGNGNDVVYGGSGNDEMIGGSGDDSFDGGDGLADTAVYAGASSAYSVVYNASGNSFVITDSNTGTGSEGKDTLTNVEQVKFSDGLFTLGVNGLTPASNTGTTPPTNTPGIVLISGIGSVGNTLTATVSDQDGIPGAISYQWQLSLDQGSSWADIAGAITNTCKVSEGDVGNLIQVAASYIDGGAQAESPVSLSKSVLAAKSGDLVVTLMKLAAPAGTSIINPLTTLLKNAVDLGLSPAVAAQEIKKVLGIPVDVTLQSYDAYSVLQSTPKDPVALVVEKVAVEVAILTSLSDDDTGMNLTLAILGAAAKNQTYNLAKLNDVCSILGVDPLGTIPDSVSVILDRNSSMSSAIKDGGDVSDIEKEWVDFCGIQDKVNSTSIADLSIHLNQGPEGSATLVLPEAVQNQAYVIAESDLLQGFTDPDGGALGIESLQTDATGNLQANPDGTWSFTPSAGYTGPVELTYSIVDGQGGTLLVSQLFVVAPSLDVTSPTITTYLPGDAVTGVAVGSDIKLSFSETIQLGTGAIEIHSGSPTGAVIESYDVATSTNLTISGATLTIDPTNDLAYGTHYFVTFSNGSVKDLAGNGYAGTNGYDFTTAASAIPPHHNQTGSVTFWKTGAAITGVASNLVSTPPATGTHPVEFRNIQTAGDGTRTLEIWETSAKTDIDSLQLELVLSTGSTATWQDAADLPAGWSAVANTGIAGEFILGGMGMTALPAGPVKLGALTLTAPANPQHFELLLSTGQLGNDTISAFGIASDSMSTGADGLYQHLDMPDGTYALTSARVSGTAEGTAITANDAFAALKIAVGMNPNTDSTPVSPYQYLAADVNKDGQVKAADALNILKMAVKLNSLPEKEWLFVPECVGSETMSHTSVLWPVIPEPVMLDQAHDLHLIGIVTGDVNGSWAA